MQDRRGVVRDLARAATRRQLERDDVGDLAAGTTTSTWTGPNRVETTGPSTLAEAALPPEPVAGRRRCVAAGRRRRGRAGRRGRPRAVTGVRCSARRSRGSRSSGRAAGSSGVLKLISRIEGDRRDRQGSEAALRHRSRPSALRGARGLRDERGRVRDRDGEAEALGVGRDGRVDADDPCRSRRGAARRCCRG